MYRRWGKEIDLLKLVLHLRKEMLCAFITLGNILSKPSQLRSYCKQQITLFGKCFFPDWDASLTMSIILGSFFYCEVA